MRQTGIDFKMAPPGGHEPNLPIMAPNAIGDLALTPGTLTPGTLPARPPRGHSNQRRLDPGVKIAERGEAARFTCARLAGPAVVLMHRHSPLERERSMNTASRFTVSVALLVIAHAAFAFTPYQGQWWNPDESGSGYNIDIRNGVLVMTVYSYQADGDAQWYLTAGPMSADGRSYTGTLDQYRDGQCISCSYAGRPINTGNAGTVSIAFASETAATLTLPGRDVF